MDEGDEEAACTRRNEIDISGMQDNGVAGFQGPNIMVIVSEGSNM